MYVLLKDVKEHDSILVKYNGLASLKQGKTFAYMQSTAKLTKVTQDMEALENEKRSYDSIFKGMHKQHINKRRRKKKTIECQMKERGSRLKTTSKASP